MFFIKYQGAIGSDKINLADFKLKFDLGDVSELIHYDNKKVLAKLNATDGSLLNDLTAALCQQLFLKDFITKKTFIYSLLNLGYALEKDNFEFRGFMLENEGMVSFPKKEVIYTESYIPADPKNPFRYNFSKKEDCHAFFSGFINREDFNVFVVAGGQDFSSMDLRIKKCALLVSELIKHGMARVDNILIILSGKNNAKAETSAVRLVNESNLMANLFVLKLRSYLELLLVPEIFTENDFDNLIENRIILEDKSRDTVENVRKTKEILEKHQKSFTGQKQNLFVISSSYHIQRIYKSFKKDEEAFQNILGKNFQYILVGAENPLHFFPKKYSEYAKNLFLETLNLNFNSKIRTQLKAHEHNSVAK